jgi:hypothetical protein
MEVIMFARVAWRVVLGVVLVGVIAAGLAAIGWVAYNTGLAQGAAQSGAAAPAPGAVPAMPLYGYAPFFFHPYGFGWLGCLIPLFVIFLVFAVIRPMMWGPWMGGGHRGWGMHGRFGGEGPRQHFREMAEEWHRQAHAAESAKPEEKTDRAL